MLSHIDNVSGCSLRRPGQLMHELIRLNARYGKLVSVRPLFAQATYFRHPCRAVLERQSVSANDCGFQKLLKAADAWPAHTRPGVCFSVFAAGGEDGRVAFESPRLRASLSHIQPAAQYQQEIRLTNRQIGPTISVAADHANPQWIFPR